VTVGIGIDLQYRKQSINQEEDDDEEEILFS
jgi:hypothetical protein